MKCIINTDCQNEEQIKIFIHSDIVILFLF